MNVCQGADRVLLVATDTIADPFPGELEQLGDVLRAVPAAPVVARHRRQLTMAKLPKLAAALAEQDTRLSEVLRLSLVEGLSIRAVARRLQLSRRTVRRLLGRAQERTPPSSEPRGSLLDTYDAEIRHLLADTPELTAPGILERLRPLGYTGGVTIRRSTCITTNRLFKDWPKVFPDALNAQVIAERLTERAERFILDGKGYRLTHST